MHKNRSLYTLPQYQKIIRGRYHRLGLVVENTDNHTYKIFRPIPATPWIPEGRRKYFRKIRSRLDSVNDNNHFTFCTLTYSTKLFTNTDAATRVKSDIDKFFKRLYYRKTKPQYFYVIELTDNFMVHIHLIFDRYIHKSKLFKSWHEITGSLCIKIKHLPTDQAFYYCTKYLSNALKQNEGKWSFIFSHIDRIWSSSRKFFTINTEFKSLFSFQFMVWNKDHILDKITEKKGFESEGVDLSDIDYELLNYDSIKTQCQISNKKAVIPHLPAQLACSVPLQANFDFFSTSIYFS